MLVAPSILAADFLNLEKDLLKLNSSPCDYIHLDVMDGCFVENITFGFELISKIKTKTTKKLDVHLMVEDPTYLVYKLVELGVDFISIHAEILQNVDFEELLKITKQKNITLGISLNPLSDVISYEKYIKQVDYVLLMSVHPGRGGQKFMEEVLVKVQELRNLKADLFISIDGGVNKETIGLIKNTSINMVVAGSFVFNGNINDNITLLK